MNWLNWLENIFIEMGKPQEHGLILGFYFYVEHIRVRIQKNTMQETMCKMLIYKYTLMEKREMCNIIITYHRFFSYIVTDFDLLQPHIQH